MFAVVSFTLLIIGINSVYHNWPSSIECHIEYKVTAKSIHISHQLTYNVAYTNDDQGYHNSIVKREPFIGQYVYEYYRINSDGRLNRDSQWVYHNKANNGHCYQ